MKKVVFVCLGNICRSPMAEFVMKSLTDDYEIAYNSSKASQQISKADFEYFDYIIGMDESNLLDLTKMCPQEHHHKIEAFASESVPDPWYTGDFDETYHRVLDGCRAWLTRLENEAKNG